MFETCPAQTFYNRVDMVDQTLATKSVVKWHRAVVMRDAIGM